MTDTRGNTYRAAVSLNITVDTPAGDTLAIFYAENVAGGANTVTVRQSTGTTLRFAILEYSGVATTNSLDVGTAAQGTSASPSSGTVSTTASGDLLLGAIVSADGETYGAGSGFALRDAVPASPNTKLVTEERIQSAAGAASATATLSAANPWGAVVAAFRPASAATPTADLTITKTHAGSFSQGQTGASYTLTVRNSGSTASSGTVTVTDSVPAGLVPTAAAGTGWSSCGINAQTVTCTRSDVLAAQVSYPPLTVTVNVAATAPASVTNSATVSGGADANTGNNTATDVTSVTPVTPTDTQPPTSPGNLAASAAASEIDLTWSASTDNVGVTSYTVERCQGVGCTNFSQIGSVSASTSNAPLVASANPNYFQDGATPIILSGSHTWNDLQDWGGNGSLQPFDFNAYVNFLKQHGHNFTLLWRLELPKFCGLPTGSVTDYTVGPHPWQRTGPGTATDGGLKFDLTKFDQSYFDRLRARVSALNGAGIYAGVYLFTGEWLNVYRCSTDGYPLTGANNVNGIDDGGGAGSVTMTAANAITAVQDAYVKKTIDTLNDLRNVLWIVSEEAPTNSAWWNAHVIAQIRSYEATKPTRHPVGYATLASLDDSVIINSDADWVAPAASTSPTTTCGSGNPRCKVNINDSDHSYFGMWNDSAQTNRNYAWHNFTNGNQVVFMDPYVVNYPRQNRNLCASPVNGICASPDSRWNNFRDTIGAILRYSRKLNLAKVLPHSSLCSTGNCLAQTPATGAEYLVYSPSGGNVTVDLSAMSSARRLNVEWFNPSNGATTTGSVVAAGSRSQSFTPPFSGDAVLYLVDSAGHAGGAGTAAPSTSFRDTAVAAGSYSYRVRAADAAGNLSGYSNIATASIASQTTTAVSLVQHSSRDAGTTTSSSLAFSSANTTGNWIGVAVRAGGVGQTISVSDSRNNTYRRAVQFAENVDGTTLAIFYAENIAGGSNTVTVTDTQSNTLRFAILEYAGVASSSSLENAVGAQGTSAAPSAGAIAASAGDLVFGLVSTANPASVTAGSGFVLRESVPANPNTKLAVEDRLATTSGSFSATASLGATDVWGSTVAAFRAAGAPSSDTQAPSAPASLQAAVVSPTRIDLTWGASTDNVGVTNYQVERCVGSACSNFAFESSTAATAFSDTGLTAGATYAYRVLAQDAAGNRSPYSNTATATTTTGTTMTISPRTAALTPILQQQFTAAGATGTVTWAVDGVPGGTTATGQISSSGLYSPTASAGTHTVTARTQTQSASAALYVSTYAGTFTRDVDNIRTGLNPAETVLSPANVNSSQFGKLYSYSIDGVSDASPLYVANVSVPGKGLRNVVYVATEHDSVYAFDADGIQTAPLWQVSFITPAQGVTTVPPGDTGECCDISPEIGITGTPVIDPATNTLYVVAKTKEVSAGTTSYVHRLHALDITTGAEKLGGPRVIQASVSGTGDGAAGGRVAFISLHENQRSALLLNNGVVYIAFASHGDNPPYHGWVLGYSASTLQQVMTFNSTPNGEGGGIWQSGDGIAADANGNLFFVTGDGTFDANSGGVDYGDSIVKINPAGTLLDYFTPHDQATMDANDIDLGSGGTILLPDQPGAHPHLALSAGKNGTIYVVDRDNLGHYRSGNDSQIVQSIVNTFPGGTYITGNFKAPVYWNGYLYFSADADYVKAFRLSNGQINTTPASQSSFVVNYPGSTLGMSSNGAADAVLWVIERVDVNPVGSGVRGPGILHAFDATNLANELYASDQAANGRDGLDFAAKWAAPLVANGKVFVATNSRLTVFGLLP
ncbi:MAG TPA: putative collagen-binding domain-containing protein [Vicinamibacterales bacterium]